jgi:hypothetical protein
MPDGFRVGGASRARLSPRANLAAMAEGVSPRHTCHDAIYVDRTFNAGQYLQSLDRIHRLGLRARDGDPDHVPRQ